MAERMGTVLEWRARRSGAPASSEYQLEGRLVSHALDPVGPKRGFIRERLPEALAYYTRELGVLKGHGPWRQALCCFHEEHTPSLSVNVESGHFRCFACDAKGDLPAFHMRRHGLDFKSACKALGAWR